MSSRKSPRYIHSRETNTEAKRKRIEKIRAVRRLFAQKRKINASIARLQREIGFLCDNPRGGRTS